MLEENGFFCRDAAFWLNRRVLVTGHTGFPGSWLACRLSEIGADVTGFARRPAAPPSLFGLARLDRRLTSLTGDIRDRARVEHTVAAIAPEIVFHLAGRRAAAVDLKRPLDSFDTNATGTLNLLHAARSSPRLRAIVMVTTDEPSGPVQTAPAAAEAGFGEPEPTAASLACAAIIAETFRQCYLQPADGIGLASLRLPELVGGGDGAVHRLVPALLRAMAAGHVPALDRPAASHPIMHVLDAVDGCLALAPALVRQPRTFARSWSLRPAIPAPWTRAAIADHFAARLGGSWTPAQAPHGSDRPNRHPDLPVPPCPGALAAALGWQARVGVATALDWALEGQQRLENEADGGFLDDQCHRYAALAQAQAQAQAEAKAMRPGGTAVRLARTPAMDPSHVPASA
jgi:CDP-glucose 4,6-dehydratase